MANHELKTWPQYWDAIRECRKTFELRYNDRGFKTGDTLFLRRWSQPDGCYVKPIEPIECIITYVMDGGGFGLAVGWVCIGFAVVAVPEAVS